MDILSRPFPSPSCGNWTNMPPCQATASRMHGHLIHQVIQLQFNKHNLPPFPSRFFYFLQWIHWGTFPHTQLLLCSAIKYPVLYLSLQNGQFKCTFLLLNWIQMSCGIFQKIKRMQTRCWINLTGLHLDKSIKPASVYLFIYVFIYSFICSSTTVDVLAKTRFGFCLLASAPGEHITSQSFYSFQVPKAWRECCHINARQEHKRQNTYRVLTIKSACLRNTQSLKNK